jgi:plasmid stability protein
MAVSFSIKDVPDDLAQALRERAARNRRSVQGELMHILETTVRPKPFRGRALWRELEAIGLSTSADSTSIVRKTRDRR